MIVYLLTVGDGSDGYEWDVKGIYSSFAKAEAAKKEYHLATGLYSSVQIEEWEVQ